MGGRVEGRCVFFRIKNKGARVNWLKDPGQEGIERKKEYVMEDQVGGTKADLDSGEQTPRSGSEEKDG